MICTFYAHYTGFGKIVEILEQKYPKAKLVVYDQEEFHIAELEIKGGLFGSSGKIKMAYRQRQKPSYQLLEEDLCPLSQNLKGLYGYVSSFPANNEYIRELLLQKITTINAEFSLILMEGRVKNLEELVYAIAQAFDAFLFVQPGTVISRADGQHFVDKNLELIIDGEGNCAVSDLVVNVDPGYFEAGQLPVSDEQRERRQRSEKICSDNNIPVYKNQNALFVASGNTVALRTKDEVVDRAMALCYIELKSEGAEKELLENFDQKYNVQPRLTRLEKQFADDEHPSQQDITNANWRAESFHTLLWALSVIDRLEFPSNMCNIGEDVGRLFSKTEEEFRNAANLRSKEEILDQTDLALRLNWACVQARINNEPPPGTLNPSVVYERHYALNWLVNSLNQDWDDITTNT